MRHANTAGPLLLAAKNDTGTIEALRQACEYGGRIRHANATDTFLLVTKNDDGTIEALSRACEYNIRTRWTNTACEYDDLTRRPNHARMRRSRMTGEYERI